MRLPFWFGGVILSALAAYGANPDPYIAGVMAARPGVEVWSLYGSGETHGFVADPSVSGGTALHIDLTPRAEAKPWDIGVQAVFPVAIHKGDTVRATFWAKAAADARKVAFLVRIGGTQPPYVEITASQQEIAAQWGMYTFVTQAKADFAPGQSALTLQVATGKQTLDLGPVFLMVGQTEKDNVALTMTPGILPLLDAYPIVTHVEDATVVNGPVRLAATLHMPTGKGPFATAVIVPGHGAYARNVGYRALIEALVTHGIAVIDYDKRGCGASGGKWETADLSDLAGDAAAVTAYLKTRPDIDPHRIGLIGASEGTVLAPMVAVGDPAVSYLVLLGGVGLRMDRLTLSQVARNRAATGATQKEVDDTVAFMQPQFTILATAKTDAEAYERLKAFWPQYLAQGMTADQLETMTRTYSAKAARERMVFDPAVYWRQVRVPVLALTGSLDIQTHAGDNFPPLREALAADKDVSIREMPGLNHVFQRAKTGLSTEWKTLGPAYADAEMLRTVADWIAAHTNVQRKP